MVKSDKICDHEVNPVAARFPLVEGAEFEELVESVRTDGLRKPILMDHLGRIVDGRNRLRACHKAGVKAQFRQLNEGDDVLRIVLQENVLRRHLTPSQRAMIAADLAEMGRGRPAKDSDAVSSTAAADRLNVSRASVNSAKKVKATGTPELQQAVHDGKIDVKPAAEIASLPPAEQREAVAAVESGNGRSRRKPTAAQFNRDKWRAKAEVAHSKLIAEAPPDLQDWARGTFRDVTGGALRREARINVPDGDDASMYDADDVVSRIEGLLKEIPVSERKEIKQAIGKHFIGDKPDQYLPEFQEEDAEAEKLGTIVSELRHRLKQMESFPEVAKILKKAAADLKKLTKSDGDSEG